MRVLDLACGEGIVAREISKSGAEVYGADISPELITMAQKKGGVETYHVAAADKLNFAKDHSFDAVVCVLALQNMNNIEAVFAECARVLTKDGRFIFVLNHPAFRIPKRSSWGFDKEARTQYRRLDGYMSAVKVTMVAHPGSDSSAGTVTFHRPLQEWFKSLKKAGLAVIGCEEWISHRQSEAGPRTEAENRARKEFPLFLACEASPHNL